MKVSEIVTNKIDRFKTGYVFTYDDFNLPVEKIDALKKVLSRLAESGKIVRLSKGKYYKPKEGIAGPLKPDEYQVVKDLLEENGKIIGYLSGINAFNKLGLTTQVSNTIQVGTNIDKKLKKRGKYTIRFIRQKNTITKENIPLLQILDSIRFIRRIPDAEINESCERLRNLIKNLSDEKQKYLVKLALKYNPATRALTGAILESIKGVDYVEALYKSLRGTTAFNLNISDNILKNKDKWQIR
jgi:predicted transcriptional regulator of viral defense system